MSAKIKSVEEIENAKVLFLNLKTEPFKVMITGEKYQEYRDISKWMNSRVFNKDGSSREYDYVKFVLGMGADKPMFISKFVGIKKVQSIHKKYSTGFEVNFDNERYAVCLAEVVYSANLNHPYLR